MVTLQDHGAGAATGLVWGIKESFLRYVATIPDGLCELFDGAAPYSPGRFLFPGTDREEEYGGALVVTGYGGLLSVTVADPLIRTDGERSGLVVDAGGEAPLTVAELRRVAPAAPARAAYTATLTAAGARWLGDVYEPGTELDRVDVL